MSTETKNIETEVTEVESKLKNFRKLNDKQMAIAIALKKFFKGRTLCTQAELREANNTLHGKLYAPAFIIKNVAARPSKATLKEAGVAARGYYDFGVFFKEAEKKAKGKKIESKATRKGAAPVAETANIDTV